MRFPEPLIQSVIQHAESEYPKECCGFLLGTSRDAALLTAVVPCRNIQDQLHAEDSLRYPRRARSAYFIAPEDLLSVERRTRSGDEQIRGIYHSHIDAGAYFSDEDKKMAVFEGEPVYPGVFQAVVSVLQGKAAQVKVFLWNSSKGEFGETLTIDLPLKGPSPV